MFSFVDPNLSWDDLKWMKERAPNVSFVIKGIGSVEVRHPIVHVLDRIPLG